MSTNCIQCVSMKCTGTDLLCDLCRAAAATNAPLGPVPRPPPKIVGYFVRRSGSSDLPDGRKLFSTKGEALEEIRVLDLRGNFEYEIVKVVVPSIDPPDPLTVGLLLRMMGAHDAYDLDESLSVSRRPGPGAKWLVYRNGVEVNFADGRVQTIEYQSLEAAIVAGLKHLEKSNTEKTP